MITMTEASSHIHLDSLHTHHPGKMSDDDVSTSSTERVSELASDFNEKASLRSFSSSSSSCDGDDTMPATLLSPIKSIPSPTTNPTNPQSGSIGTSSTRSAISPPQSVVSEADIATLLSAQVEEGLTLARVSALEKSHSEPALSEYGGSCISVSSFAISPYDNDCRKLFIGGLAASVTEAEFRSFFEAFGKVGDSRVMVDNVTKRNRGFGFVTFEDPEVVRQVVSERHSLRLNGKPIDVKRHRPKSLKDSNSSIASSTVDTRPKPPRVPGSTRLQLRGSPTSYPRPASSRNGGGSCSSLGDIDDCVSICSSTGSNSYVEGGDPSEHDYHGYSSQSTQLHRNGNGGGGTRNNYLNRSVSAPSTNDKNDEQINRGKSHRHHQNKTNNRNQLRRSSSSNSMHISSPRSHHNNSSRPRPSSQNSNPNHMYDAGYYNPQPMDYPPQPMDYPQPMPMQMMYAYMMPVMPAASPGGMYYPYPPCMPAAMPMYGAPPPPPMEQQYGIHTNDAVEDLSKSALNESELTG